MPLSHDGGVKVPEYDDVAVRELSLHRLAEEIELRLVVTADDVLVPQHRPLVAMADADAPAGERQRGPFWKAVDNLREIAIPGDGRRRGQCVQLVEDGERDEIPGVDDAIDSGQVCCERLGSRGNAVGTCVSAISPTR